MHKIILGSGLYHSSSSAQHNNTILIISNDEIKEIIVIVKYLEDSGLLFNGVSEIIQNEAKEQRGVFLCMLLGTLGATLWANSLADKGINTAGEGTVRFGYSNKKGQNNNNKKTRSWKQNWFLMLPHPLTNFKIQKYYQNENGFNGVYSRDNLLKIKNEAYVINLDEDSDIGAHWIALYLQNNDVTYFDSFAVEHIPKEI